VFTTWAELGWAASWRIGFVGFAGLNSVSPSVDRFSNIPAGAGTGIRFLSSKDKDHGFNVGVDFAVTKEGYRHTICG